MPDIVLSDLCKLLCDNGLPASLEGRDGTVRAVNTLDDAVEGEISFLSNPKYLPSLRTTRASAVVARPGVEVPDAIAAVRCDDPYAAMTVAMIAIHGYRKHPAWGISDKAHVHPSATIADNANIAAGATIAANVVIGEGCTIYPGCYVAENVQIGRQCMLYPNVVIYDGCRLGDRVTIHAGSIVGQDGLGYAPRDGKWIKIPQIGRAIIGDDVEIGANCAIDRATLGETEIASGSKFGNAVVIGHGTRVGSDCLFVGQVGVAGSANIGRHVTLAGQVGVAGHISIGDDVRVGAQSGISGNVEGGAEVLGSPAIPMDQARRALMAMTRLPDWIKRIKELENEVQLLRKAMEARPPH